MFNPFRRRPSKSDVPVAPLTTLHDRNALELEQMQSLEAQIAHHLTTAAMLRTRQAAEYQERVALENQQIVSGEVKELWGKVERVVQGFKRVGIPGIEVEILRSVPVDKKGIVAQSLTISEYVGVSPISGENHYQIAERVNGWLIPGRPRPKRGRDYYMDYIKPLSSHYYHEKIIRRDELFDDKKDEDRFSDFVSLILTEDGRNWSSMLTPFGITDGTVKGVLEDDANDYLNALARKHEVADFRESNIKEVQSRISTMLGIARQYGHTKEELLGDQPDGLCWNQLPHRN